MRTVKWMVLSCLGASFIAHADQPTTSTAPAATVQTTTDSAAAQTASAPAAPLDDATAKADAKKAAAEAQIKKYGFGGYKPEFHNGNTVYCHKETPIGSRFEQKTCRSLEQLLAQQKQGQDYGNALYQLGAGVRTNPIDTITTR
jgi:hypothetical protein